MFSATSRYQGIPTAVHHTPDGREITYVRRRILPHPEDLAQIGSYTVRPAQRPDLVAFAVYGDAEQWWRLADGNGADDPDELTARPGRILRVTLPPQVPAGGLVADVGGGGGHG
ncbi:LysM domain-containing protein [Nocardia abscessus]|uniref:LysM domain-containing protein n=1 Tax=Nocardia abscessus TaxID=120957 RepID=UPI001895D884|nr:LysM domain-containing protein [Nocardia abscessus]MBF6336854.1 LysM domain-containing protein [Nocardia abscessus]